MKKKILFFLFFLAFFLLFSFFPKKTLAYQQTESVCYSQCLAYRFIWQGTTCYDVFADNCTEDNGNTIKKAIMFLKSVYNTLKSGDNIDIPFKVIFLCKPLIESCIVPNQQDCEQTCAIDKNVYAPDLSVGHPESSFHGIYYDENSEQLYFKLVNNGMGYAWDIDVEAQAEYTQKRDGIIEHTRQLFKEKVEHLIYLGARNGPPKSFSDSVGDFLVEESLNGQYLHDFKSWVVDSLDLHSDSKNYNVPNFWIKALPFTPVAGYLNRITFKVDPNGLIPEVWEQNNTFVLDIDLRPAPARFTIVDGNLQQLVDGTLNSFSVHFIVKNTGEENGSANAKIFEGKYQDGKTPIYQYAKSINAKSYLSWDTTISFDPNKESKPYCGNDKEYTLVVFDQDGNKTERSFSLPMYLGSVNGSVKDLLGKKVAGTTIKASTGEETTADDAGYYHLKGITTPGKITITATHPEFSQSVSKELEFKFVNEFDACKEGNLHFNSVNFVLKDQDVLFTIAIKDSAGNPVTANVLAVNSDFRFKETVSGTGPLPGMQPGKYMFTISAPGYRTISQDVNAVPNDLNLEFILEKLIGRPDDTGLQLITPRLLWSKTLGNSERIISNMSDSKNGNLLVAYVLDNKAKNSNLYFLDLITGKQNKETSVPYGLGYEGQVALDASYNGGTVGLSVGIKASKGLDRIVKVFDSSGNEFGSITETNFRSMRMDVSPDGFYLCPGELFNKGLHKYTLYETEGKMDYKRGSTASAGCGKHFLRNNNIVISCEGKQEGYCEETLSNQQVRVIGDVDEGQSVTSTLFDSAFNDQTVVVRTFEKLYYFGASSWKKEVESDNMYKSVAVSPGGMYTIVTEGIGASLKLKVYGNTGGDKTPDFPYKYVRFVFANDKGLFFASVVLNRVEFYQIGEYQNEYNPGTTSPTVSPDWTDGISFYRNDGQFSSYGEHVRFNNLQSGYIFRADKNIKLNIFDPNTYASIGTLSITKDTLFSVDNNKHPVLLKGQMTADFGSPMTIYALKFDRFEMGLFQSKLNQFIAGTLAESEYFIVQNIHTKFTVKNSPNQVLVAVSNGEVQVKGEKTEKTVTSGKQITINAKNEIKESIYISSKVKAIIFGVLILILSVVLFIYRKTKVGGKIIEVLKKTGILIWKYFNVVIKWLWKVIKILVIFIWKMVKKGVPILWKGIKRGCQNLINLIKKLGKKNK